MSVYAAAKSGVVSLSKGMYTELRPFGVRVTAVDPGRGATELLRRTPGLAEPATPFLLKPEDMAEGDLEICQMPAAHRDRGVSLLGDGSGSDSDVGGVMRCA